MNVVLKIPGLRKTRPLTPVPPGAEPGTLVVDTEAPPSRITVIAYGPDELVEHDLTNAEEVEAYLGKWPVTWVNVDGLGDAQVLETLGELFKLHRLALEDVLNVRHRPKLEQFEEHLFIVTRMPFLEKRFRHEQISVFLGSNYVLTFQEREGDCLDPLRDRLRQKRGAIRHSGPDYLAYGILDAVVDGYFPVLEEFGERLETLEQEILINPTTRSIAAVQHARRDLLAIRRSIWPQRELLSTLVRDDMPLISDRTRTYLRDAYDHAVRIMDLVDTYRELSGGLSDLYMSSVSNRMNDVMKVLTIMATIFIPLTFIAGIYGMNFNPESSPFNMPELAWYWGYPTALFIMAVIAVGMTVYFRRKGWIGSPAGRGDLDEEADAAR